MTKPIDHWWALGMLLAACAASMLSGCREEPAESEVASKYNVVLISIDTLRADRLNCYGYEARETSPNIDALAADGILFENHTSTSPWTTPSHMSLMTSLYPSSHGVTESFHTLMTNLSQGGEFNRLPSSQVTLAEVLKDRGFATGAFTAGAAVDPNIGFGQGFTVYDTSMYKLGEKNMSDMFGWLDRNAYGEFFLFWHNFEVHAPYLRAHFLADVLPASKVKELRPALDTLAGELSEFSPDVANRQKYKDRMTTLLAQYDALNREVCEALYCGGIRSVDEWLGRFMQELRDRRLYEQTLIILTSDHGEEFEDHNENKYYGGHGHTLYQELVRVPLILKLPGQRFRGKRISRVVSAIDVMPTVLDVLSCSSAAGSMQGKSLRPLWEGDGGLEKGEALSESLFNEDEKKSIRVDRYKYVVSIDENTVAERGRAYVPEVPADRELYDLNSDPLERTNLLDSDRRNEFKDLAVMMEQQIRKWVRAQPGETEKVTLDEDTLNRLRALGYIGGAESPASTTRPAGRTPGALEPQGEE